MERTVGRVLDRLIAALEANGDVAGAIAAAGRRIDLDPLDESAHVRRMELLAAAGDRAGAVRQYRACVAVLERELGVDPLAETTARYEAIREGQASVVSQPAGAVPHSALEPAIDPERLPLVGRDVTLRAVDAIRRGIASDGRTVALVGEPGIGKSRLAQAIADEARAAGAVVLATSAYAAEQRIAYGPIVGALELALRDSHQAAGSTRWGTPSRSSWPASFLASLGPGRDGPPMRPMPPRSRRGCSRRSPTRSRLHLPVRRPVSSWSTTSSGQTGHDAALAYLLRRLTGRPVLVLVTWRDDEPAGDARLLADLAEERAGDGVFRLGRLGRDDVDTFVRARFDVGLVGGRVVGRIGGSAAVPGVGDRDAA